MFIVLLILIFLESSSCQVCRKSVLQVREVPETYHYTYYEAYQGADCLIWCTKSRLVTKTGIRMVQKMFNEFLDECCDGYAQNKTNSINCQPTCDPPCENAICQHPNHCICNPGYVIDAFSRNTCIPQPNDNSNSSNCPVTPACKDTIKSDITNPLLPEEDYNCPLHVKEKCCNNIHVIKSSESEESNSYFNDSGTNNFEAVNNDDNSTSDSKDSDVIVGDGSPFDYYEDFSDPSCTEKCMNCKCVADETWVCEPRWYFNEDKTECLPHCDACVHGVCKAPNICECFEGYHLSKLSIADCIPDCNCSEGCLVPNVCINQSRCEKCEDNCSNEVVITPLETVKPSVVEERDISKTTSNNLEDVMHFEEPIQVKVISQKTFKDNQSTTETKSSGIPIYWVYIAAAIVILFLIALVILIKRKMRSKFGNTRKFSFVDGAADKNNMTVQYTI